MVTRASQPSQHRLGCSNYEKNWRGQHHFALRHVKSQQQKVKHFKLLEAMFNSDRDFFKEMRKIHGFNK